MISGAAKKNMYFFHLISPHTICTERTNFEEGSVMSSSRLRIGILLALTLGIYPTIAALADGEGDDNEVEFTGVIEHLPGTSDFTGDWQVSGRTVHVTSATH